MRSLIILLALWCYGLCGAGTAASGADFPVKVSVPEGHGAVGARLIITMADAEGRFITDSGPLRAPVTLDMKFSSGKTIEMRVEADGYWSAPRWFITVTTDKPIEFSLLPTGKIQSRILAEEGETAPADLDVRFESPPEMRRGQKIPQNHVTCPVTDGRLLCEVPAGVLDVRLKAEHFIPHYLWGVSIAEGKELDLGSLVLRRGGSVSGRDAID